jgi:hypothetical protein
MTGPPGVALGATLPLGAVLPAPTGTLFGLCEAQPATNAKLATHTAPTTGPANALMKRNNPPCPHWPLLW